MLPMVIFSTTRMISKTLSLQLKMFSDTIRLSSPFIVEVTIIYDFKSVKA